MSVYILPIDCPPPGKQLTKSPFAPDFWLTVNDVWVPRSLILANKDLVWKNYKFPEMVIVGNREELSFLPDECFRKGATEEPPE